MGGIVETSLKLGRHIRHTPHVAASTNDEETHESEFSEDSEQFSDGDSDYGNCV